MKNIEIEIKKYLDDRGWDKLRPSDLAKSISIEAAELLELFQWTSMSIEETKADEEKMEQIKKELADVFIYALDMSVLLDFDTEQIIKDKLNHINKKFPAELMRKNAKQESGSGTDPLYLQIKKEYRGKGE
ncbi:MAG: nucleotide pyrophosphohydrolase [Candidatus Paceibacterota bacterium]